MRWDTDRYGDPTKTFDNYDRFAVGIGGPTPVRHLTYFASYEGTYSDTYLRTTQTRSRRTVFDFIQLGNRQSNQINTNLKLALRPNPRDKLTLETISNRSIETPYEHMWSRQGYVQVAFDTVHTAGQPDMVNPRFGTWSSTPRDSTYQPVNMPDHVPTIDDRYRQLTAAWTRQISNRTAWTTRVSSLAFDTRLSVGRNGALAVPDPEPVLLERQRRRRHRGRSLLRDPRRFPALRPAPHLGPDAEERFHDPALASARRQDRRRDRLSPGLEPGPHPPERRDRRSAGRQSVRLHELQPRMVGLRSGSLGVRRHGAQRGAALRRLHPGGADRRRRSAQRQALQAAGQPASGRRVPGLGSRRVEFPLRLDLSDPGAQRDLSRTVAPAPPSTPAAIRISTPRPTSPTRRRCSTSSRAGCLGSVRGVLPRHLRPDHRAPGARRVRQPGERVLQRRLRERTRIRGQPDQELPATASAPTSTTPTRSPPESLRIRLRRSSSSMGAGSTCRSRSGHYAGINVTR